MLSSIELQEECIDNALELAMNGLQGLSLEPPEKNQSVNSNNVNISSNSADQWVQLFVNEMMTASSMDDARARARKALEGFENSMNAKHKEKTDELMRENWVLKRAVVIQREHHQKEKEESQKLKEMVSGYQEQLKALEVKNYALTMHLRQATQQESSRFPQNFHPDVF